jgi:hypothetical protein
MAPLAIVTNENFSGVHKKYWWFFFFPLVSLAVNFVIRRVISTIRLNILLRSSERPFLLYYYFYYLLDINTKANKKKIEFKTSIMSASASCHDDGSPFSSLLFVTAIYFCLFVFSSHFFVFF